MPSIRQDATTWTLTDDGSIVVLDLRTSRYMSLNGSGAFLWQQLITGMGVEALTTALQSEYGISADTARDDVGAFVDQLRERDLIVN